MAISILRHALFGSNTKWSYPYHLKAIRNISQRLRRTEKTIQPLRNLENNQVLTRRKLNGINEETEANTSSSLYSSSSIPTVELHPILSSSVDVSDPVVTSLANESKSRGKKVKLKSAARRVGNKSKNFNDQKEKEERKAHARKLVRLQSRIPRAASQGWFRRRYFLSPEIDEDEKAHLRLLEPPYSLDAHQLFHIFSPYPLPQTPPIPSYFTTFYKQKYGLSGSTIETPILPTAAIRPIDSTEPAVADLSLPSATAISYSARLSFHLSRLRSDLRDRFRYFRLAHALARPMPNLRARLAKEFTRRYYLGNNRRVLEEKHILAIAKEEGGTKFYDQVFSYFQMRIKIMAVYGSILATYVGNKARTAESDPEYSRFTSYREKMSCMKYFPYSEKKCSEFMYKLGVKAKERWDKGMMYDILLQQFTYQNPEYSQSVDSQYINEFAGKKKTLKKPSHLAFHSLQNRYDFDCLDEWLPLYAELTNNNKNYASISTTHDWIQNVLNSMKSDEDEACTIFNNTLELKNKEKNSIFRWIATLPHIPVPPVDSFILPVTSWRYVLEKHRYLHIKNEESYKNEVMNKLKSERKAMELELDENKTDNTDQPTPEHTNDNEILPRSKKPLLYYSSSPNQLITTRRQDSLYQNFYARHKHYVEREKQLIKLCVKEENMKKQQNEMEILEILNLWSLSLNNNNITIYNLFNLWFNVLPYLTPSLLPSMTQLDYSYYFDFYQSTKVQLQRSELLRVINLYDESNSNNNNNNNKVTSLIEFMNMPSFKEYSEIKPTVDVYYNGDINKNTSNNNNNNKTSNNNNSNKTNNKNKNNNAAIINNHEWLIVLSDVDLNSIKLICTFLFSLMNKQGITGNIPNILDITPPKKRGEGELLLDDENEDNYSNYNSNNYNNNNNNNNIPNNIITNTNKNGFILMDCGSGMIYAMSEQGKIQLPYTSVAERKAARVDMNSKEKNKEEIIEKMKETRINQFNMVLKLE